MDLQLPHVLAEKYRLEERLAVGGMGQVFRATQLNLQRAVAVKLISPRLAGDPTFAKKFCFEAAMLARLVHPNIVTVHDYGASNSGELFMAMEYLQGRSLAELIAAEPELSMERILHIALQICRALRESHRVGVIHRDLKPANIMLVASADEGQDLVKVLDFGIAKINTQGVFDDVDNFADTRSPSLIGSPPYMSPEQVCGDTGDQRCDIYAFGCIFYEMLTGTPPFRGDSAVEIVRKHINEPVPPITPQQRPDLTPAISRVLTRTLAKLPEHRYSTMQDVIEALKLATPEVDGARPLRFDSLPPRPLLSQPPRVSISTAENSAEEMAVASIEIADLGVEELESQLERPLSSAETLIDQQSTVSLLTLDIVEPKDTRGAVRSRFFGVTLALVLATLAAASWMVFPRRALAPETTPIARAETGTLVIESEPAGAVVFIGGEPTGLITPATVRDLTIGKHIEVRLEKAGLKGSAETVVLSSVDPIVRHFHLEP